MQTEKHKYGKSQIIKYFKRGTDHFINTEILTTQTSKSFKSEGKQNKFIIIKIFVTN